MSSTLTHFNTHTHVFPSVVLASYTSQFWMAPLILMRHLTGVSTLTHFNLHAHMFSSVVPQWLRRLRERWRWTNTHTHTNTHMHAYTHAHTHIHMSACTHMPPSTSTPLKWWEKEKKVGKFCLWWICYVYRATAVQQHPKRSLWFSSASMIIDSRWTNEISVCFAQFLLHSNSFLKVNEEFFKK